MNLDSLWTTDILFGNLYRGNHNFLHVSENQRGQKKGWNGDKVGDDHRQER